MTKSRLFQTRIEKGNLQLEAHLTPKEKKFYRTHGQFTINTLYHPDYNGSIQISFDPEFYKWCLLRYEFLPHFQIPIQSAIFKFAQQLQANQVKVIILPNKFLIVSDNLDLRPEMLESRTNPLKAYLFQKCAEALIRFETSCNDTRLEPLYHRSFTPSLHIAFREISLITGVVTNLHIKMAYLMSVLHLFFPVQEFLQGKDQISHISEANLNSLALTLSFYSNLDILPSVQKPFPKRRRAFLWRYIEDVIPFTRFKQLHDSFHAQTK